MTEHFFLDIIPKMIRNQLVDSGITKDGKFVIFYGQIKQDTITEFCFMHLEGRENLCSSIQYLSLTMVFKVNLDFSGGFPFSLYNGIDDALPVFFGK